MNAAAGAEGAIAFTDLVGFTEFTATRGDEEALVVLRAQERIVDAALPDGARVVKELGDGLLLFLPDADSAVAVCLDDPGRLRPRRRRRRDAAVGARRLALGPAVATRRRSHRSRRERRGAHRRRRRAGRAALLGHDARRRGASDAIVEFVELGPVVMKGIPDPIDLYRVERLEAPRPDPVPADR